MKTETVPLGYFEVESDQLVVSDPCYDLGPDTWCADILKNPKQGRWYSSVEVSDQGSWGHRVAELFACFADLKGKSPSNYFMWEPCDFEVGVDSGQAGIFDLPMYKKDMDKLYLQVGRKEYDDRGLLGLIEMNNKLPGGEQQNRKLKENLSLPPTLTNDWYEMCCDKTLSNQKAGTVPGGVVSSSGFGDGGYRASFAKDDTGKVIAVRIVFIDENDIEALEDEYEEYDKEEEDV